jgi:hypothetical protein
MAGCSKALEVEEKAGGERFTLIINDPTSIDLTFLRGQIRIELQRRTFALLARN